MGQPTTCTGTRTVTLKGPSGDWNIPMIESKPQVCPIGYTPILTDWNYCEKCPPGLRPDPGSGTCTGKYGLIYLSTEPPKLM